MIRRPPRSTLFPTRRSSDLGFLRSRLLPARQLTHVQGGVHVLRVRVPGRPDPYREPLSAATAPWLANTRSEEHTPELQPHLNPLSRLLFDNTNSHHTIHITP